MKAAHNKRHFDAAFKVKVAISSSIQSVWYWWETSSWVEEQREEKSSHRRRSNCMEQDERLHESANALDWRSEGGKIACLLQWNPTKRTRTCSRVRQQRVLAGREWLQKFFNRYYLSLQRKTTVSQRLPTDLIRKATRKLSGSSSRQGNSACWKATPTHTLEIWMRPHYGQTWQEKN